MVRLVRNSYTRLQVLVLSVMVLFASAFVPVEAYAITCWQKQASQLGADLWKVEVDGAYATVRLDTREKELASLGVKIDSFGAEYTTIGVPNSAAGKVTGFLKVADRTGTITNNPVVSAFYFQGTLAIATLTEPKIFMVVRKNGETECKVATGNEESELVNFFKENNLPLITDSATANSSDAFSAALGFGVKVPARKPEKAPTIGEAQVKEELGESKEFTPTPELIDEIDRAIMGE